MLTINEAGALAADVVAAAIRSGAARALYKLDTGVIKHYPAGGALALKYEHRHRCFLLGVYDCEASEALIVEDLTVAGIVG